MTGRRSIGPKEETVKRYLGIVGVALVVSLIAIFALSLVMVQAAPNYQGDVGSRECRIVQLEAQAAAGDPAAYKNHGQWVAAAAQAQDPYVYDGTITEECSSCIMNQFGRGIPIEEQEPCGPDIPDVPECAPASCGNFIPCNEGGNCGSDGVCVQTDATPSGGTCVYGPTPCGGLGPCAATADCAAGEICAFETCCGDPVCIPPDAFCFPP